MVNIVRVNAEHGRDIRPLAHHRTKLRKFNKGEIDSSAFPFSLQLIFEETLSNLRVCLMISQKFMQTLPNRVNKLQWILGVFCFSQS